MVHAKSAVKLKVIKLQIPQPHVLKFVVMENFMITNVMMGTNLMEMDAQKIVWLKKIGVATQVLRDQFQCANYRQFYQCL